MSVPRPVVWLLIVTILAVTGCASQGVRSPQPEPPPAFEPELLEVSPDAASGPDYVTAARIEHAGESDYFQLVLHQSFNSVVVMSTGDTDTVGTVETEPGTPIVAECEGEPYKAEPPCVWGDDSDLATPHPQRSAAFNSMPASKNFLWEGSLDAGSYYIRVTGEGGATGAYGLVVELGNQDCPTYYCDE